MKWLNTHPNWTIFIVWLVAVGFLNLMIRLPIDANSGVWWFILAVIILMVWGVLAWSLKVKKQSLFKLFYLLIPFIGWFIVWGMSNKSTNKEIEQEVINGKVKSD